MQKINTALARKKYHAASRRIMFLSYEGAFDPSESIVVDYSYSDLLNRLCADPKNHIALISSLATADLDGRFGNLKATLVAEDGGFVRSKDQWQIFGDLFFLWKQPIITALRRLQDRYPNTTIDEKHFSVTWNYSDKDKKLSDDEKKQLSVALRFLSSEYNVPMHDDGRSVEFRASGISRSKFAASWMALNGPADFILAIGNKRDDQLFNILDRNDLTVKIGCSQQSHASYCLDSKDEVIPFLKSLSI